MTAGIVQAHRVRLEPRRRCTGSASSLGAALGADRQDPPSGRTRPRSRSRRRSAGASRGGGAKATASEARRSGARGGSDSDQDSFGGSVGGRRRGDQLCMDPKTMAKIHVFGVMFLSFWGGFESTCFYMFGGGFEIFSLFFCLFFRFRKKILREVL